MYRKVLQQILSVVPGFLERQVSLFLVELTGKESLSILSVGSVHTDNN